MTKSEINYLIALTSTWTYPRRSLPHLLSFLQTTTREEVWKIICKSPSKSCTLDPIPTSIIRDAKNELLPTITDIINASLRSSEVPTSMKSAITSITVYGIIVPVLNEPVGDLGVVFDPNMNMYAHVSKYSSLQITTSKTLKEFENLL